MRDGGDRYAKAFAAAAAEGRTLFMPYVMAGFPSLPETLPLIEAAVAGGADALELGVPFSDPLADGPTIQRVSVEALRNGANLPFALECVRAARARDIEVPITLMGYLNPFLAYQEGAGIERLAEGAAAAGIDGLIIVDLPPEESDEHRAVLRRHGVALIYLLAPTSTEARIRAVAERAAGFVYLVSVTGVTGARADLPADLVESVARVKAVIDLPIAVGFGISTREQVETVGELCEAAVIASALINAIEAASLADRVSKAREFIEVASGRRRENADL